MMNPASHTLLPSLTRLPITKWGDALRSFSTAGGLEDTLQTILRHRDALEHVARASFFHATGGYKLVLVSSGYDAPEVRLHIWPTGSHVTRDHNLYTAHNHKWDFASYIINGAFLKTVFAEETVGAPLHDLFHYDSPVRGEQYTCRRIGPRCLRELLALRLGAGNSYTQVADVLHTFTPSETTPSITLFARTSYHPVSYTRVYVPLGHHPIVDFPTGPPPLTSHEVEELANLVLGLIQ